jgi:hypothetical protein
MEGFTKYRKKPITIEAIQFNRDDRRLVLFLMERDIIKFENVVCSDDIVRKKPIINTREGKMIVEDKNYIIRGIEGEFYPIDEDIFNRTYEEV